MRQTHSTTAPQRGKCCLGFSSAPTESPEDAPGTSSQAGRGVSWDAQAGRAELVLFTAGVRAPEAA